MTIEFDKIELSDEAAEALKLLKADKAFTDYVATSVQNREEAVRQSATAEVETLKGKVKEFRDTNLALKKDLERFDGFDAEEYKRLQSLGSDANAANERIKAMELEYRGVVEGLETENKTLKEAQAELAKAREDDAFRFEAQTAIQNHNAKFPTVAVKPKAATKLIEEMMRNQKVIDGKRVMLDNGKEFTTDAGIGSVEDWINTVARRELDYMFDQPTGGGATGNSTGGAGSKQMTRAEFTAISDPVKRSEVARTYAITD